MFDKKPSTSRSSAVPATAVKSSSSGQRKNFHYIETLFNPDIHDQDDIESYVVPNEGELVFDVPNGIIYFVSHVDIEATWKTTLTIWNLVNATIDNTYDQDDIFGVRGGPLAGEAILAVDYSIRPNRARVDSTIMRPEAAYAKLYRGNDLTENGVVISAQYDGSGVMLDNKVPTLLAAFDELDNRTIYTTGAFSVTATEEDLKDGSRATLVFFDEGGNFIPPVQPVMTQHTSYMRDHQVNVKYVTGVELVSPWFTDSSDPDTILVPINTDLFSIEFRGRVNYSDGTSEVLPVNGDRFTLEGLEEHRPTTPGHTSELVLSYLYQNGEQAYMASPGDPYHESKLYNIKATEVKGAYSPKIYTVPQWNLEDNGYELKHYLYDLDRDVRYDVTDKVTFNETSIVWKPRGYGIEQNLVLNINMRDVSPTYESFVHTQHTTIVLLGDLNLPTTQWTVSYVYNEEAYSAYKLKSTETSFNLSEFESKEALLERLYYSVKPGYFTATEERAPEPTHFYLETLDGVATLYNLDNWENVYDIATVINPGYTHNIYWVTSLQGGEMLQLATTGVTPTFE